MLHQVFLIFHAKELQINSIHFFHTFSICLFRSLEFYEMKLTFLILFSSHLPILNSISNVNLQDRLQLHKIANLYSTQALTQVFCALSQHNHCSLLTEFVVNLNLLKHSDFQHHILEHLNMLFELHLCFYKYNVNKNTL